MVIEREPPEVIMHYVQIGDPQKAGEDSAACSCGEIYRSSDREDCKDWAYIHTLNERRKHRGLPLFVESKEEGES